MIIQSLILDAPQSTDDQHKKFILAKQMRTSYAKLNIQQVFLPILTMLIIVKMLYTNKHKKTSSSGTCLSTSRCASTHSLQKFVNEFFFMFCFMIFFIFVTLWLIYNYRARNRIFFFTNLKLIFNNLKKKKIKSKG